MRSLILLPFVLACDPEAGDSGASAEGDRAHACLSSDPALTVGDPEIEGELATWEVEGTVVSDEALPVDESYAQDLECYGTASRRLTIEDAEGRQWYLTYGIHDGEDADLTPALDVATGQALSLRFRHIYSFGTAEGFVLQDEAGLVAVMETGTWGPALQEGDVTGLAVSEGEQIGEIEDDCGTRGVHEVVFQADEEVSVAPVSSSPIAIGGIALSAWAIAWEVWQGEVGCTDLAGTTAWAVFR